MKKLIALAALFSAPLAFAAQNSFTFDVNSSGANMYVCGFSLFTTSDFIVDGDGYATWDEVTINEWTGEPTNVTPRNSNDGLDELPSGHFAYVKNSDERVSQTGEYTEIRNLNIYLSSEKFNMGYTVDVCYNVPLFMDLSKVDFDITAQVAFSNQQFNNRDYLGKANVEADVSSGFKVFPGSPFFDDAYKGADFSLVSNGNATAHYVLKTPLDVAYDSDVNYARIRSTYSFYEHARRVKRPHVAHGGTFKLDTTVVPVAKDLATN